MPYIKMDCKYFDLLCCNWIRSVQIRYRNFVVMVINFRTRGNCWISWTCRMLKDCSVCCGWLVRFVGLVGWLVGCLLGLVAWLVGWLIWLVGLVDLFVGLVGLVGWLVGWFSCLMGWLAWLFWFGWLVVCLLACLLAWFSCLIGWLGGCFSLFVCLFVCWFD